MADKIGTAPVTTPANASPSQSGLHPYPSPGDLQREAIMRNRVERLPPWRISDSILYDMPEDKPRPRLRSRVRPAPKVSEDPRPTKKQKLESPWTSKSTAKGPTKPKVALQKKISQNIAPRRMPLSVLKNPRVTTPTPKKTLASLLKNANVKDQGESSDVKDDGEL